MKRDGTPLPAGSYYGDLGEKSVGGAEDAALREMLGKRRKGGEIVTYIYSVK